MTHIILRAKSLDALCNTNECEYLGPFASYDEAHRFAGIPSYADCGEGPNGLWFWIVELKACAS